MLQLQQVKNYSQLCIFAKKKFNELSETKALFPEVEMIGSNHFSSKMLSRLIKYHQNPNLTINQNG